MKRSEDPLHKAADSMINIGPDGIHPWLLRRSREASTSEETRIQARFARSLGVDGSTVSRIEHGTRSMPDHLRQTWLEKIDLDHVAVDEYLADLAAECAVPDFTPRRHPQGSKYERTLFDKALAGEPLTPREWAMACWGTVDLGLPRMVERFCALITRTLATTSPSEYSQMTTAMRVLPQAVLADAIARSVEAAPARGYHAMDVLAGLGGRHAGPLLLHYLKNPPDPWMLRSVAEAIRRLVSRGHHTHLGVTPHELQGLLVESIATAPTWTSRIELTNLASSLGQLRPSLWSKLAEDADPDVRYAVGVSPSEATNEAVACVEDKVRQIFDSMRAPETEDEVAQTLGRRMLTAPTRRDRIMAARALGLSAYRDELSRALPSLLSSSAIEVRRTVAQALMYFPSTDDSRNALTRCAREDPEPDIRGRAVWSLIPLAGRMAAGTIDIFLTDTDDSVRRCAVDLAGAARYKTGLQRMLNDSSPPTAADARTLLSTL